MTHYTETTSKRYERFLLLVYRCNNQLSIKRFFIPRAPCLLRATTSVSYLVIKSSFAKIAYSSTVYLRLHPRFQDVMSIKSSTQHGRLQHTTHKHARSTGSKWPYGKAAHVLYYPPPPHFSKRTKTELLCNFSERRKKWYTVQYSFVKRMASHKIPQYYHTPHEHQRPRQASGIFTGRVSKARRCTSGRERLPSAPVGACMLTL